MKVLVPWKIGLGVHTRSGYADFDWEERRRKEQMVKEEVPHFPTS